MSGKRYTEEFKIAAVKQVAQRGHPASKVAERLGVSSHSLYAWTKCYGMPEAERKAVDAQSDEMRRHVHVSSHRAKYASAYLFQWGMQREALAPPSHRARATPSVSR